MAGNDASVYLSAVRWGDEGLYLHEFMRRFNGQPQVARIIKGQYLHLGVPSLPSPSLTNVVFLAKAGRRIKVAAQCVKFKDNRRVVSVGPKLAIPENYPGWFEILSEDGRAARCYESVAELVRRFPDTCLVRESIKVHSARPDDPETLSEKSRSLPAGETLVLVREVQSNVGKTRSSSGRYLRCVTSKGDTVYLAYELRGRFSPLAKEDNISGVHTIRTLLSKRFPLMVRLVHGKPQVGLKSSATSSEMRLYSIFEEEGVMALPLLKDVPMVSLPISAALKLQAPKNAEILVKLPEYTKLTEKCKKLMEVVCDNIQVFDMSMSKEFKHRSPPQRSLSDPLGSSRAPLLPPLERGMSNPETVAPPVSNPDPPANLDPHDQRYDEIDQIYDYVRGFAPLPEKIKAELQDSKVTETPASQPAESPSTTLKSSNAPAEEAKPPPPPIETIPVRRYSVVTDPGVPSAPLPPPPIVLKSPLRSKDSESHIYEAIIRRGDEKTRQSKTPPKTSPPNNKLFIKSPNQNRNFAQKPRFFRHTRSAAVIKDVPVQKINRNKTCHSTKSVTTSPLFNIRYKSLTNLAIDFNNTLDSSNSGGRTSSGGGSGVSKEFIRPPYKISRPKSLSNLFWDVEANNKYNLIQNELKANKFIYADVPTVKIGGIHNKRVGTLYL